MVALAAYPDFAVLANHATDPVPISTTIRKCASEFKKVSFYVKLTAVVPDLPSMSGYSRHIRFVLPCPFSGIFFF